MNLYRDSLDSELSWEDKMRFYYVMQSLDHIFGFQEEVEIDAFTIFHDEGYEEMMRQAGYALLRK